MRRPRPLSQVRDEVIERWWRISLGTEPFDEARARGAIRRLAVALNGGEPRAILVFGSPRQVRIAAGFIRPGMFAQGPRGGPRKRLIQRLLAYNHAAAAALGVDLVGVTGDLAVRYRRAIGALVATAVEPVGRFELDRAQSLPVWLSLMRQVGSIEPARRAGIVRDRRKRQNVPRALNIEWRSEMDAWLAFAVTADYLATLNGGALANHADAELAGALMEACRETGGFWIYPEMAIVSDRPSVLRLDPDGRPHATAGPAIAYRDGFAVYASRGVHIPADIIEHPHVVGVLDIDRERNAEVRRVMLEQMGVARYLELGGAQRVSSDETGTLWRRTAAIPHGPGWDVRTPGRLRTLCFVEVVNGTREPDGTRKRYFLRVPPDMRTARQAVAWTYGFTEQQYRPQVRT